MLLVVGLVLRHLINVVLLEQVLILVLHLTVEFMVGKPLLECLIILSKFKSSHQFFSTFDANVIVTRSATQHIACVFVAIIASDIVHVLAVGVCY